MSMFGSFSSLESKGVQTRAYGPGSIHNDPERALQHFVPTVFIGLGGSGKDVLMRLRKRFHDRFVLRDPPYARFVFVETNAQSFVPSNANAASYAAILPSAQEKVDCKINEAQYWDVFNNLRNKVNSEHLSWLKPEMQRIPPQALADGAGTHRQFGRLAFFLHYPAIRQAIETQVRATLAYADQHANEVEPNRIEIVIVTSLAGGTGSGMFIDAAYLARDILRDRAYDRVANKHITLLCFLPSLWSDQAALYKRLQQNSYAALLELEYFGTPRTGDEIFLGDKTGDTTSGTGFHATWGGRDRYIQGVGWDACFLIDNVNDLAPNNPMSRDEVFQMAADYLFLDFEQHTFAVEKRSARSNLVQLKDRWMATWVKRLGDGAPTEGTEHGEDVVYATQNGCTFSTFGLAEIYFDVEKLYLAAGYRIASHLIRRRWIGAAGHSDNEYKAWVRQDLFDPPVPTNQEAPPSFRNEALTLMLLRDHNVCWPEQLERDLDAIDQGNHARGLEALKTIRRNHEGALHSPNGPAVKTIAENLEKLKGTPQELGKLRARLREVAAERSRAHGVATTLELLKRYQVELTAERKKALERANQGAAASAPPGPLARLEEAATVPFPVQGLALSIEYPRAWRLLADSLRGRYHAGTGAAIDQLLIAMSQYIGSATQPADPALAKHRTLHRDYSDALTFLTRAADRLDHRFGDASKEETKDERRKIPLSLGWAPETYDKRIDVALVNFDKVGEDRKSAGPFRFHWGRFEQEVLDRLRKDLRSDLSQVQTVDALIGHWIANRETNEEGVMRIAEVLASACRAVLRGDGRTGGFNLTEESEGNAVDLLTDNYSQAERDALLDKMVKASSSYLPTSTNLRIENFAPAYSNLYGQKTGNPKTGNKGKSEANATNLQERIRGLAAAKQSGPAGEISSAFGADNSSVVLVREMAGFPLLFYSHLDSLYSAYIETATPTGGNDECHINFNETWMSLPDVRLVEPQKYTLIREKIHFVLLGMMTGVIDWVDDAFRMNVPDVHNIGTDTVRLGTRIHRVIKHACEQPRIWNYLERRWKEWDNQATPAHWAALHASVRKTWLICQSKEINIETGLKRSAPIRNNYSPFLKLTKEGLNKTEEGKRWLTAYDKFRPTRDGAISNLTDGDREASKILKMETTCLRQINPHLPIFQIIESRISQVEPFEPSGTPASVS